ncbi:hypothetical conserved protein [Rhizobium etli CFN 42]|uniref:Uncharacterized protein n=2 Tax=Rhizobium etli TaxID=29449 RepID=A0AAN1BDP8_RHIET|nr:hypothetical conserved protein [Rhizobium etli CFN 42]AGS20400.1 hypothetical protein REMIM1_CH00544 [Rhizobium etli bv. mimosae str. Mim1]ARQ08657.1 hypothetical protein NXC12_CH00570 [Rhizobium etli]
MRPAAVFTGIIGMAVVADRQWPCGMTAKTALLQLLRNRSLTCDSDAVEWKGTAIAACRLGTQDLGTWLAENGWAEAKAGCRFHPSPRGRNRRRKASRRRSAPQGRPPARDAADLL